MAITDTYLTNPWSVHPGELLQEILDELDISAYALAKSIGKAPIQVSRILSCTREDSQPCAVMIKGREYVIARRSPHIS